MKTLMAGVAASTVLVGLAASAQGPERAGRQRGPGGPGSVDGVASYLGLTDEQKAQLAEHREKARPQAQALFTKMRENREKMRQALEAQAPDPAAVGTLAIEGHQLRLQMKAQRDVSEKELRSMLTPEQQTKLDALQALRAGGRRRGRGGPMGSGGPMHFRPPDDVPGPGGPGDEPPPLE
jgi:Spy/CpxP family protein refolding chaperone